VTPLRQLTESETAIPELVDGRLDLPTQYKEQVLQVECDPSFLQILITGQRRIVDLQSPDGDVSPVASGRASG
jgi:hypothetical protein